MKNKVIATVSLFIGVLVGIIFLGITLSVSGQYLLIRELKSPYDFEKTVEVLSDRIEKQKGWHVVVTYDQNEEVKKHGGTDIGKMKVIEYCSGKYASQMLKPDNNKRMGAMLPKRFAVYEKSDGTVYLSTSNGEIMGKFFHGEAARIINKVEFEVEEIISFIFQKII